MCYSHNKPHSPNPLTYFKLGARERTQSQASIDHSSNASCLHLDNPSCSLRSVGTLILLTTYPLSPTNTHQSYSSKHHGRIHPQCHNLSSSYPSLLPTRSQHCGLFSQSMVGNEAVGHLRGRIACDTGRHPRFGPEP